MTVEGEAAMLLAVDNLTKGYDRRARRAVKEGGEVFAKILQKNTPVSNEDKTGKGPLAEHVKVTGVSVKSGEYEVGVGYDKQKGQIAHFPNSGTSKQDPQFFIEESQQEGHEPVLDAFIKNMKGGV
ncbi:MAG: HK97 gp10 family phage protein [Bacillota bacterium]|nr:HK97 gp10 family phage protein [Bacillota bacterium]